MRLIWDLIFAKVNKTCSHLYFSSQLCSLESFTLATSISVHSIYHSQAQLHHFLWTFPQFLLCVVAQKMLSKAFFDLTSLCINAHWQWGSQLSKCIYIIYPPIALIFKLVLRNIRKLSLLCMSFSQFWFLLCLF